VKSILKEQERERRLRAHIAGLGLSRAMREHRQSEVNLYWERQRAAFTLEKLRYKWWVRRGTMGRLMQCLGDFGRRLFG
jgi:hypothetical protein